MTRPITCLNISVQFYRGGKNTYNLKRGGEYSFRQIPETKRNLHDIPVTTKLVLVTKFLISRKVLVKISFFYSKVKTYANPAKFLTLNKVLSLLKLKLQRTVLNGAGSPLSSWSPRSGISPPKSPRSRYRDGGQLSEIKPSAVPIFCPKGQILTPLFSQNIGAYLFSAMKMFYQCK